MKEEGKRPCWKGLADDCETRPKVGWDYEGDAGGVSNIPDRIKKGTSEGTQT